jgi:hypothetical protein
MGCFMMQPLTLKWAIPLAALGAAFVGLVGGLVGARYLSVVGVTPSVVFSVIGVLLVSAAGSIFLMDHASWDEFGMGIIAVSLFVTSPFLLSFIVFPVTLLWVGCLFTGRLTTWIGDLLLHTAVALLPQHQRAIRAQEWKGEFDHLARKTWKPRLVSESFQFVIASLRMRAAAWYSAVTSSRS